MARLLDGDGRASVMLRRAAFEKAGLDDGARVLVEKVATNAAQVTDEDFDTARRAGLGEDEIWEIVVCAAVGQATRQYRAAVATLHGAVQEGRR
jgi:alkylhydroperoxidase family enzyme